MSVEKMEKLNDFLKNQENFLLKDEDDQDEDDQDEDESRLNGGYFKNGKYISLSDDDSPEYAVGQTEDDGYYGESNGIGWHVSQDGETLEIFYEVGRAGDENDDWIREARKSQGVNDNEVS